VTSYEVVAKSLRTGFTHAYAFYAKSAQEARQAFWAATQSKKWIILEVNKQ
jgi:hypothetical protein